MSLERSDGPAPGRSHEIVTLETPELGDRSYLATDGLVGIVIDPQRDIDRVLDAAAERNVTISHVLETHIHNDYVSGGLQLSRETDAAYLVAADEEVRFERVPIAGGDSIRTGELTIRAIHTPGHTPAHLSFVLYAGEREAAVFTGGSMLFGSVGRTDLMGEELTDGLTRAQYHSVRKLAQELEPTLEVHPTHGFGSFCSSSEAAGVAASSIARERATNIALSFDDENDFVESLLSGLTAYPRYYAHMGAVNRQGPAAMDLRLPKEVDASELHDRIGAGEWIVDIRDRVAFAAGHVEGTINVAYANPFTTYLGWTIPWGTPLTLIGESEEMVAGAQRALARIGIDRPAAQSSKELASLAPRDDWSSYPVVSFADLASRYRRENVNILDVRRDDEWASGHIKSATHIPLVDLETRMNDVPDGEVWVHCESGFRASIAASLLDRAGRETVLVNDDWDAAASAGLEIVS